MLALLQSAAPQLQDSWQWIERFGGWAAVLYVMYSQNKRTDRLVEGLMKAVDSFDEHRKIIEKRNNELADRQDSIIERQERTMENSRVLAVGIVEGQKNFQKEVAIEHGNMAEAQRQMALALKSMIDKQS